MNTDQKRRLRRWEAAKFLTQEGYPIASSTLAKLICPLQSGPKVNLDWTLKETEHGQEARA